MDEIERALAELYRMMEESDSLGLSRSARLRVVGVIGDLEAALLRKRSRDDEKAAEPAAQPDAFGQS